MSETIVTEYSGSATRGPERVSGDTRHMRIVLVKESGNIKELFRGKEFDEQIFQDAIKGRGCGKSYLDAILKKEDGTYELRVYD